MTATKEQLQALLERVEKATGPDRELGRDIFQALDTSEWTSAYMRAQEPCGCPHEQAVEYAIRYLPDITASIDAALALVERVLPGHTAGWQPGIGNREWATIYRVAENEVGMVEKANHATLPLAILAATLKALILQPGEKTE